ncbi:MAG: 3-methyl-2-oxobutanoate hydroxymethyltransferase [Aeromicrobium sp.]
MVDATPEETAPYGSGPAAPPAPRRRIRTHTLQQMKQRGEKWTMLTAYDQYTAATFDEAGVEVLLIGDSASNNVYGNESSLPVTVDELIPLVRAVSRSAKHALVLADLPFGSYQGSPEQAFHTAVRFMKEAGAHAVKLEGGLAMVPQVKLLTDAGIPVCAHIGFTPQSEHQLGGYRVQGRGDGAARLVEEARAFEEAGAFAVLMEMVPAPAAAEVTRALRVPTVGIGAGVDVDAQVLVWQDMLGLNTGRAPRFVKRYADLHQVMLDATKEYVADVKGGSFPAPEHSFES